MEVQEDTMNTLINAESVKHDMIYVPQQTLKFDEDVLCCEFMKDVFQV